MARRRWRYVYVLASCFVPSSLLLIASACGSGFIDALSSGTRDDAGAPDTGGESSSPPSDAGTDAAVPPSDEFCAKLIPAPSICLDFDGDPYWGDWQRFTGNGGTLTATTDDVRSKPRALEITIPATATGAGATIAKVSLTSFKERVVFSFDVRVEERSSTSPFDFATITLQAGPSEFWILRFAQDSDGRLGLGETFPDGGEPAPAYFAGLEIVPNRWNHVVWTTEIIDAGAGTSRVVIDGDASGDAVISPISSEGTVILIGDSKVGTGPYRVRFDNVTANIK